MNRGTIKKKKLPGRSSKGQSGIARNNRVKKVQENSHRAIQVDEPSVAKNSISSLKSATEVPPSTFQFYVSSHEGIHLYVDLNSRPSDWTNRFRSEFHVSEILYRNGSKSLRQDLSCLGENSTQRSSFFWNTISTQNDNHNGQIKTFPSLKVTRDDLARFDQQDEGGNSSISALLMPSGNTANEADNLKKDQLTVSPELTAHVAEHLKEGQSMVSVEVSFGVPNHYVSGDESCAKDGTKAILDSSVINTPLIKSLCGSVRNSVLDPGVFENQNSKPDNEISEDFTLPNTSCIVNPGVGCTGASEIGSMELQNSDVASCQKYASVSLGENDVSLDQNHTSDTGQGRLVNSSELNLVNNGNSFQSLTEEWEANKIVRGRESSECSQFDDPLKNSGVDSDDRESKMELQKKRKQVDPKDQSSSGKHATRVLRSMKHVAEKVSPRRSTRLISKVASFFGKNYTHRLIKSQGSLSGRFQSDSHQINHEVSSLR